MKKAIFILMALGFVTACDETVNQQFDTLFQAALEKLNNEQYQAAFTEFKTLSEKGYVPAQLKMIEMLLEGKGVRRNETLAIEQLKNAAEKGHSAAQTKLGNAYFSGEFNRLPQDYHQALKWFEKAAEKKEFEAQYKLGEMYQHGWGVRQNKATAKELFGKACDNGSQTGCEQYRQLLEQGY